MRQISNKFEYLQKFANFYVFEAMTPDIKNVRADLLLFTVVLLKDNNGPRYTVYDTVRLC